MHTRRPTTDEGTSMNTDRDRPQLVAHGPGTTRSQIERGASPEQRRAHLRCRSPCMSTSCHSLLCCPPVIPGAAHVLEPVPHSGN
ncbi:hypothetical protein VTO73DRAFT_8066 [Trametes versicolor]